MENFVAAACRTKSNWFDFVRRVAATKALGKLGNIVPKHFSCRCFVDVFPSVGKLGNIC